MRRKGKKIFREKQYENSYYVFLIFYRGVCLIAKMYLFLENTKFFYFNNFLDFSATSYYFLIKYIPLLYSNFISWFLDGNIKLNARIKSLYRCRH